jgi:hypothetical protein
MPWTREVMTTADWLFYIRQSMVIDMRVPCGPVVSRRASVHAVRRSGCFLIGGGTLCILALGCGTSSVASMPPTSPMAPARPTAVSTLPPPIASRPQPSKPRCRLPLSEYCRQGSCPTHEESRARFERIPGRVWEGSCGSLRYIRWGNGFSMATEYFDAEGKLVGAEIVEDYPLRCPTGAPGNAPLQYGEAPDDCS